MFCSKCGSQLPDTSKFCNVCGQDINNIAPAVQPTHVNQSTLIVGNKQPDVVVAYLLWFFLGIFGVHHLYVGRGIGIWLLALITLQGFGLLWFADLFLIPQSCSKIRNSQTVILR